jgi:hypothetical protein
MKKRFVAFGFFLFVGIAGTVFLNRLIPYNLDHRIKIQATHLASSILTWKRGGEKKSELQILAFTNASSRSFLIQTNFLFKGKQVAAIVACERDDFQSKGILLGTTEAEIFWVGKNGVIKKIR